MLPRVVRDLVLVEGPGVSSLVRSLSELLRARVRPWSEVGGDDVEGMEALVVYPMREPFERYLAGAVSVAERISGRARRIVLAVPYVGLRASGRVLQYLAGGLDLLGADHVVVADPPPDFVTSIRTPLVAISAYPGMARWLSSRARGLPVMAPPRLVNRAEAFSSVLGSELRLLPDDDPGSWGELEGSLLLWDVVSSCEELRGLARLRAAYYAIPHVGCGEEVEGLLDLVAASDSVDNPYAKFTISSELASAVLAM